MNREHIVDGKIVNKIGQEFRTIKVLGQLEQPFITIQANNNGQGKVIISPELVNLSILDFKNIFSNLETLNKKRDYDNRFKMTQVSFIENHKGTNYNMVFKDINTLLHSKNIWSYENSKEAKFISKEKAIAFADFLYTNTLKFSIHFKEELPELYKNIKNIETNIVIDKQKVINKIVSNNQSSSYQPIKKTL